MKVRYIVHPRVAGYDYVKTFTFGKTYQVIADYRNRHSKQQIADNGLVVIDDQGQKNMLFMNEIDIIEDDKECFVFKYK